MKTAETNKYPRTFWIANFVELLERAAYYAMFIIITIYLSSVVGFSDVEAGIIGGIFSGGLYLLPLFTGAISDKMGFRNAILLAFFLLAVGYFFMGFFPAKIIVLLSLFVIMMGGSFIKSIITGTVAKSSTEATRAKAYSIFYMMVNIGSFSGKTFAAPLRKGEWQIFPSLLGEQNVILFSAILSFIALVAVYFYYKNVNTEGQGKTLKEITAAFIKVSTNIRLLVLIIIVTGFWMIQHQLYATMPKYILRIVGEDASPEWIANVNPLVVVSMVFLLTSFMKRFKAITSMTVGMFLMPISALLMAFGPWLQSATGTEIQFIATLHPYVVMMIAGIAVQGLAECFISPRYLEFFSLQAPKGEEGLYLGFSHLHSFLASVFGFGISGFLLEAYCPDPVKYPNASYDKAHYIWYIFAGIGLISAIALLIYSKVVAHYDKNKLSGGAPAA